MFSPILVPTDFSAPSDAALACGRMLANQFGASLHLLHVAENVFLRAVVADPRTHEVAAVRRLHERLTDEDRRRGAMAVVERSDEPADVIASYARTANIGLIVMGTHGRSGIAQVLLGSVTERVVRTAPCPVVTIRETSQEEPAMFTRILVPTDFSAPSDAALAYARVFAAKFGASLHLLHVAEDPFVGGPLGPVSEMYVGTDPARTRAALLRDAQDKLAHRISTDDRTWLRATTEVVVGSPSRMIAEYAGDNGFDLIVMGTHGRTGLAHMIMGSVAEHVVRVAPCPVLTVHSEPEPAALPVVTRSGSTATA